MLYNQKEVDELIQSQINKLLTEIVNNSSKCKTCMCYNTICDTCFLAFQCVQQDFKGYRKGE